MEDQACHVCSNGRYVYPNAWWRDTLKQLRCDRCGDVRQFAKLTTEVNERLKHWRSNG